MTWMWIMSRIWILKTLDFLQITDCQFFLRCLDAVGWVTGRASSL